MVMLSINGFGEPEGLAAFLLNSLLNKRGRVIEEDFETSLAGTYIKGCLQ
jgi:hypothetical protein